MPNDDLDQRKNDAAKFLRTLLKSKPKSSWYLLWTLPDRLSYWCQDIANGVEWAIAQTKVEVYFQVGLSSENLGQRQRCKARDVIGIPALCIDLDLAGTGHKKKNLPKDESSAREILESFPLEPTMIVNSGGGLHVWWVFKSFWKFSTAKENREAEALSQRFNYVFRDKAREMGLDVDSVYDLARVMRVPGTFNNKTGEPRPVTLVEFNKKLYTPQQIEKALPKQMELPASNGVRSSRAETRVAIERKLKLSATPAIDPDQYNALMESDTKLRQTMIGKRRDLKDQSPSSYDMALANMLVEAGMDDQDICNYLIYRRKKAGDDLKLRYDYYARTIATARDGRADAIEVERAKDTLAEILEDENSEADASEAISTINTLLGTSIVEIRKLLLEPSEYLVRLEDGRKVCWRYAAFRTWASFQTHYEEFADQVLRKPTGVYWNDVKELFMRCFREEQIDAGPESRLSDAIVARLPEYLERYPAVDEPRRDYPRALENSVAIRVAHYTTWLQRSAIGQKITESKVSSTFKLSGVERRTLSVKTSTSKGSGRSTKSYWLVQNSMLEALKSSSEAKSSKTDEEKEKGESASARG